MLRLDPDSEAELERIGDKGLERALNLVRADPSGRGTPGHRYTRKFRNPARYVDARGRDVWEFKPSRWRGLFLIASKEGEDVGMFFLPVKGKRFWTVKECPWH